MKNYQGLNIIRRIPHTYSYTMEERELDKLSGHLQSVYPEEGCGFLLGREMEDTRSFDELLPSKNVYDGDRRRHFSIHPLDFQRAEKRAAQSDLELLGIYHSHPDHPCMPSETDLAIAMPWFSYLIVSVKEGILSSVRSWRLTEDRRAFTEETFIKTQ